MSYEEQFLPGMEPEDSKKKKDLNKENHQDKMNSSASSGADKHVQTFDEWSKEVDSCMQCENSTICPRHESTRPKN
jgi:hypothetical protein